MPEPVLDERDQVVVDPIDDDLPVRVDVFPFQDRAIRGLFGHDAADHADGQFYDLDILLLVMSAHVVNLAGASAMDHGVDGLAMVLHVQPVADVGTVSIYGKFFPFQDVFDDERDQLLGEMVGPVVVRAAGDADGHFVGIVICLDEEVRAGF